MTPYCPSVKKGLNKEDSRLPAGEVLATLFSFFPPDHFCIAQDFGRIGSFTAHGTDVLII